MGWKCRFWPTHFSAHNFLLVKIFSNVTAAYFVFCMSHSSWRSLSNGCMSLYSRTTLSVKQSEHNCSRHLMVCTFNPTEQPKSSKNKRTAKAESSMTPSKTWPAWRRISGRCLATKNNWLERTNPDQQRYAFLTVAKQRKQIMQTVWTNQSKEYEIT